MTMSSANKKYIYIYIYIYIDIHTNENHRTYRWVRHWALSWESCSGWPKVLLRDFPLARLCAKANENARSIEKETLNI